ncbi:primosomal protein N' [Clostridium sardiniense]|uniref:Replication restart protein PriA n=1 Tax=Clostridium sardiniense TaxID=29369 RepID=A0ABS7KXH7_CLOSR|nr:primosomal protein N' [Clostridium sardiniense]MBY0755520.1 primosomal protein N' [Clostridium sardiniense]MDQ0460907.1 primosomal protein N' (replication factor Y) [Clostridium sardiniense]
MELYAEVIVNSDAVEIDKPFTYKVKDDLVPLISVGHRVKIPFGVRNKPTEGFVMALSTEFNDTYKVKEIIKLCDEEPILTKEDLLMIEFLIRKTLCKHIDAIRVLIPTGLIKGLKSKKKKVIKFVNDFYEDIKNKEKYKNLIRFIKDNDCLFSKAELSKEYNFSTYVINKSIEKGYLSVEETVIERFNRRIYKEDNSKDLTEEQKQAILRIENTDKNGVLLKGVTGSGKTEIYMNLVEKVLNRGEGTIVLVPEIALTPQMIERFKGRFGEDVALFHSRLSDGERFDEWYRVKSGRCRLVVGARSAIFLPVDKLGLIIIDEEHEGTYKSEHNPKYNTKEVAEFLSVIKGCKYILGSATPSVESFADAMVSKVELIELNNRVDNKPLPTMEIVDMREELKVKNLSMFSRKLYKEMKEALERKEQIILFLNRRGFSTFISCRSCGYVFKCHKCDISMTYHKNGYLVCHYCGRTEKQVKICPKCKSKYVKFFGAGTEKVENEVRKYFKDARILRMDADTTRNKDSHEKIYNSFKRGEADILIGTQMITKGLDFKGVTLVGVLAADMSLNIPDYRSSERTFQVITQVAGRAGRGDKEGKVIIQSYTPNHPSLKYAIDNDYVGMFKEEIAIRKGMGYPPFGKILLIRGISKNEEKLKKFMESIAKEVDKLLDDEITLLGPTQCIVGKIKDKYRWQILIKGKIIDEVAKKIKDRLYEMNKSVYNEIRVNIDINPNNLL